MSTNVVALGYNPPYPIVIFQGWYYESNILKNIFNDNVKRNILRGIFKREQ